MEFPVLKQSPVKFDSTAHRYWLGDKELKGITTTLVRRAYPDTYKKPDIYTDEQWSEILANAAARGSVVHETIELYDEICIQSDLPELQSYIRIKEENELTVLATEYVVSDEKNYATAIDKIFLTKDGEIILADIKRTSVKHYDNVALQLSICRRFFEMQNPDLKVARCYLLWLRDEKYEFSPVSIWGDELLDELIKCDLEDRDFDPIIQSWGEFPVKFAEVEEEVARIEMAVKQAKERQEKLKAGLYALMEQYNKKSWTGSKIKLTRVLPSKRKTFDSKRFESEHADLYKEYLKESETAGSLKITLMK